VWVEKVLASFLMLHPYFNEPHHHFDDPGLVVVVFEERKFKDSHAGT